MPGKPITIYNHRHILKKGYRMRILLLTNLYPPHVLGGAEILARDYAVQLRALGHEVFVLTSSYGLSRSQQEDHIWRTLRYAPAPHFDRSQTPWRQLHLLSDYYQSFHAPSNVKELQRAIAEAQPDVLYIWEITGIGLTSMLKALHDIPLPIVFHLGNYWLHYAISPQTEQTRLRTRWLKKALIGSVPPLQYTSLIAVSQTVKGEYMRAGCDAERIEVIYNGIDRRFLDTPSSREKNSSKTQETEVLQLIYVGRLCLEKGVLILLQALDTFVNEQHKRHFHLNIFGDGDEAYITELQTFLHKKDLTSFVTFHGKVPQDELIQHYDRADVMLIPSIWQEPFGLVVAEAMARGLPVVASNIGGPAEIISHDVDGLLVEPGDVQDLATAITMLCESPTTRQRLGQAACSTVQQRFRTEENAQNVAHHLMQAMQQRKPDTNTNVYREQVSID
jgi:glycosyltransferase involved in cell wall biosynthesis